MKLRLVWSALALLCGAGLSWAQEKAPPAAEILDRFVEVSGGKAAYERLKNRVSSGTMEIKGAGLKGEMKVYEAPEAKNITAIELPGIGKIEQGTDGTIAWERNAVTGNRLLADQEKANQIRNAYFNGDLHWRKVFKDAKTLGSKRVADKECWEVEMTTPEGLVFKKYFDQKTGLPVLVKVTVKTPQMDVPSETYPGDWKKVDGVLLPHEMRMKAMAQEIVVRVSKVEHNVDIPASVFAIPKEIQELKDKSK